MDRSGEGDVHALKRAVEQLQLAARLLEEADNVGLWTKSEGCEDNRDKRRLLREADWAASDAGRQLPRNEEIRALVTMLEPLPDLVTDTRLSTPELNEQIRNALKTIARLLDAV